MRNKGLVLFFTILVALTCLYCLSFSFVTWNVEKNAKEFANDPTALTEISKKAGNNEMLAKHLKDSIVNSREKHYLAAMRDSSIFLGFTYKECKYKELNLGLDLKGGMNVTMEISSPDVLSSLATVQDSLFKLSFDNAVKEYNGGRNGNDFVDIFSESFAAHKLANATLANYFGDKMNNKNASDEQVLEYIKKQRDDIQDQTFRILRTRIDR